MQVATYIASSYKSGINYMQTTLLTFWEHTNCCNSEYVDKLRIYVGATL